MPLSLRPKTGTSCGIKSNERKLSGDVDRSFGNNTEFMAGGGEVSTGSKVGEGIQKCSSEV